VNELLQQLNSARQHAAGGAMDQAEQYITEALEMLDDALTKRPGPKPSARAVRSYLSEARFAVMKADQRSATRALDHALRTLEEKPAHEK
jgi:hypothetical protein